MPNVPVSNAVDNIRMRSGVPNIVGRVIRLMVAGVDGVIVVVAAAYKPSPINLV